MKTYVMDIIIVRHRAMLIGSLHVSGGLHEVSSHELAKKSLALLPCVYAFSEVTYGISPNIAAQAIYGFRCVPPFAAPGTGRVAVLQVMSLANATQKHAVGFLL